MAISQVFEQVKFPLSRDMGIRESNLSGPIATTAAPIHSWSWRKTEKRFVMKKEIQHSAKCKVNHLGYKCIHVEWHIG